nr:unnamed protein product [Callosobruchus analis]
MDDVIFGLKLKENGVQMKLHRVQWNSLKTFRKLLHIYQCFQITALNRIETLVAASTLISDFENHHREPGHTHMECDPMIATIETASEYVIYWINVVRLAKKVDNLTKLIIFLREIFVTIKPSGTVTTFFKINQRMRRF